MTAPNWPSDADHDAMGPWDDGADDPMLDRLVDSVFETSGQSRFARLSDIRDAVASSGAAAASEAAILDRVDAEVGFISPRERTAMMWTRGAVVAGLALIALTVSLTLRFSPGLAETDARDGALARVISASGETASSRIGALRDEVAQDPGSGVLVRVREFAGRETLECDAGRPDQAEVCVGVLAQDTRNDWRVVSVVYSTAPVEGACAWTPAFDVAADASFGASLMARHAASGWRAVHSGLVVPGAPTRQASPREARWRFDTEDPATPR